jgi:Protein of unknown function (DUF2797)
MWTCYNTNLSPFSINELEDNVTLRNNKITLNVEYKIDNNSLLTKGFHFKVKHLGTFQCISCHKNTKKLFDGYCFPCFKKKASADRCIMSPHLCHYMAGTCREPDWGDQFCYQPHYVYLSYTDKYKVGITRHSQIPTRWIDQGATSAALLAKVTSRNQAGVIENTLKEILHDKSHWLNMLKNGDQRPTQDEFFEKISYTIQWMKNHESFQNHEILVKIPEHLHLENEITLFESPVLMDIHFDIPSEPLKYKSINLDKNPEISGIITGIKGQYIFLGENVFNMRRHEGYLVDIELTE